MSLITVIWSMIAGICLTLAGIHLLVWLRVRDSWANLLFAISAVAAAIVAMQELVVMHAQTPAEYGEMLRWMHVSVAVLVIAIVWFVRFYLGAGRLWLAWLISGLRLLILVPNFLIYPNATFKVIHELGSVTFLGDALATPVGEQNPWRILIRITALLLVVYVVDASAAAWKRGDRQRALVLGAGILAATVLAPVFSHFMVKGLLPSALIAVVYLAIVLVMAFLLSIDLIRARQLSRDLTESQQRMSLAARAADLALWDWDIARDQIWTNDVGSARAAASQADGMSLDRYLKLIHPDDRGPTREAMQRTLEGGGDFVTEFRMARPDGAIRWLAARAQLERDRNNKPLRLRGVLMDITERKRKVAELQAQRDELAHVQRVTMLGQLSSALAHELNQPLGAILRNAEAGQLLLQRDPPDLKELQDILVDIQLDDRRAAVVIERMRALMKHRELLFESVIVDELIQQTAALLQAEIRARNVVLRVDLQRELPKIHGDRIHLQQVLLNLLLNSLDALESSREGPRQIAVCARRTKGRMVELSVVDNGEGIDPDVLPKLFEPFFTTKNSGTGIGLAISKTIVETHGGRIWAENNPDGGATVRFTLPSVERGATA